MAGSKPFCYVLGGLVALTISLFSLSAFAQSPEVFGRAELIEDTRQLARTIEATHPDPYINGGGKIAFHRRLQEVWRGIPARGMTRSQFFRHLLPFVSSIGDSHTLIRQPDGSGVSKPGLPLGFKIVGSHLVVERVPQQKYVQLLGARLQSIEGIGLEELLRRQRRLRGTENIYGTLAFLCFLSLSSQEGLNNLLPEWKNKKSIRVTIKPHVGAIKTVRFPMPFEPSGTPISLNSQIPLPSTADAEVAYGFLDNNKQTAILVIESMMAYREACESWFADGLARAESFAQSAYEKFNHTAPPQEREQLLAGIPSASERFVAALQEMKRAGTRQLIIDLRSNTGGNSLMRDILIYLLYGNRALISLNDGYSIGRYSQLYFESYATATLEKINRGQQVVLNRGDYDFREERALLKKKNPRRLDKERQATYKKMPTFWKLYQSKKFHRPFYRPKKIIVLSSPFTYSSGFNMLTSLYNHGATVVGTSSAQPGNNFGDMLLFTLNNTQIQGGVSFKRIITFPDDPIKGQCLKPHFELTYDKFRQLGYDANAEVLFALEIVAHQLP